MEAEKKALKIAEWQEKQMALQKQLEVSKQVQKQIAPKKKADM